MHPVITGALVAASILGVILRPWRTPEWVWAIGGATILLVSGLLPLGDGVKAVGKGADVYLFLAGMMVLSELARREGLFDYLAARAVQRAGGSAARLFALVYAVGTLVTVFMSNDATAVVLTPAVFAAARKAEADPKPYLFACALVANAASFVLPISNPANLVVYQSQPPALAEWMLRFGAASLASIVATYLVLRASQGKTLRARLDGKAESAPLSPTGLIAGIGIGLTALGLMAASALRLQLGWPTFGGGIATAIAVLAVKREGPWPMLKEIGWSVLPLVAGLFVLVQAVDRIGGIAFLASGLAAGIQAAPSLTALAGGVAAAVASNLTNNLPAGLVGALSLAAAHAPKPVAGAVLIGIDLGPNLSVTGSLATILWLAAIRREGGHIGAWNFLKLGALAMPAALLPALAIFMLCNP